jgi:hypothetical protein
VHVVGSGVGGPQHAAKLAHDSAHIGEKIVMQRCGDKRRAVPGTENPFAPPGLGAILLEFFTHGLRHGLRSYARFAGWRNIPSILQERRSSFNTTRADAGLALSGHGSRFFSSPQSGRKIVAHCVSSG